MKLRLLVAARDEAREAFDYYEQQRAGLGAAFAVELANTLTNVRNHPHAWSVEAGTIRRCHTARFPYAVLYQPGDEEIVVLAIMHLHRRPGYWKDRAI